MSGAKRAERSARKKLVDDFLVGDFGDAALGASVEKLLPTAGAGRCCDKGAVSRLVAPRQEALPSQARMVLRPPNFLKMRGPKASTYFLSVDGGDQSGLAACSTAGAPGVAD
jgi:hypothetical protein